MRAHGQLKLQQVRNLVLLADELHFGRAAERAFLSQSAFSRSIAAIEHAAGLRLFDRGPRSVRPTPDGQRVIERARRLLSSAGDLSRELTALRSGDLGDVAIGAGPFTAMILMPGPMAELRRLHPEVSIRLKIDSAVRLLEELQKETLDFFVSDIREIPPDDTLQIEVLGRYVGGLFCRANHPLAAKRDLGLADLKGASIATVHLPVALRRQLGDLFGAHDDAGLRIALECESISTLREFTLQSDCLMIGTHRAFLREIELGLLRELQIRELDALGENTPVGTNVGIVRLRHRTPSTAARLLMESVLKHGEGMYMPIGKTAARKHKIRRR